jgi:hypothetical protein
MIMRPCGCTPEDALLRADHHTTTPPPSPPSLRPGSLNQSLRFAGAALANHHGPGSAPQHRHQLNESQLPVGSFPCTVVAVPALP